MNKHIESYKPGDRVEIWIEDAGAARWQPGVVEKNRTVYPTDGEPYSIIYVKTMRSYWADGNVYSKEAVELILRESEIKPVHDHNSNVQQ